MSNRCDAALHVRFTPNGAELHGGFTTGSQPDLARCGYLRRAGWPSFEVRATGLTGLVPTGAHRSCVVPRGELRNNATQTLIISIINR